MNRFHGKVVIVTGAAGGIGLAAAQAFAREGASVLMADIDEPRCARAAAELAEAGTKVASVGVDVASLSSCEEMVDTALSTFGGLHIAYNNAAKVSPVAQDFSDYLSSDWEDVMRVNLFGMFNAMKAEFAVFKENGGGAVVNAASVVYFKSPPGLTPYTSSKYGVAGLTKTAALEWIKWGIRVNAVAPGWVDTPMLNAGYPDREVQDAIAEQIPIRRIAKPEDVADVVTFLASDAARYVVGEIIRVDGGLCLV